MPENIIQIDRHMPRTRLDRPTCGIVSGMIQSSAINGSATKNRARQAVPLHLRDYKTQSAQENGRYPPSLALSSAIRATQRPQPLTQRMNRLPLCCILRKFFDGMS